MSKRDKKYKTIATSVEIRRKTTFKMHLNCFEERRKLAILRKVEKHFILDFEK